VDVAAHASWQAGPVREHERMDNIIAPRVARPCPRDTGRIAELALGLPRATGRCFGPALASHVPRCARSS
jgi:hypothetical protein